MSGLFHPGAEVLPEPPHDLTAERALIAGILVNNAGYDLVAEFLEPRHFYDPNLGWLYGEIEKIIRSGVVADPVVLRSRVENAPEMEALGGMKGLGTLLTAFVSHLMCGGYGQAIRDAWLRRNLLTLSTDIRLMATAPDGRTAPEIVDRIEEELLAYGKDQATERAVDLASAVDDALEDASAASARGDGIIGLPSGYHGLDDALSGLCPGTFMILAGRPSMGKTGAGVGIAVRAAARTGKRVLYWSGEMDAKSIAARIVSGRTGLPLKCILSGSNRGAQRADGTFGPRTPLTPAQWEHIWAAREEMRKIPIVIDDRAAVTAGQLYARARRMARQKAGLGLIVVDYVGLMRGSDSARRQGRYAEVSEISADLLAMAKTLGVPVLGLQQLNRGVEGRDDKRPTMADLRDSGNLEQDAHAVMLLYREHYYASREGVPQSKPGEGGDAYSARVQAYYDRLEKTDGKAEIIIAKNRNGECGTVQMKFSGPTTWFRDGAEHEDAPAW